MAEIDFTTGSPARERDFFFRETFIDDLWDSLRKEHVLMLAPRRMGKTSVMLRLQDDPRDDRLVVFLNVEAISRPGQLCQSVITALHEQQPEYLHQALAGAWKFLGDVLKRLEAVEVFELKVKLRESDPGWEERWQSKAEELVEGIRRTQQPLLIILDELPDMVLNIQKHAPEQLEPFLHWFRQVRQNPKGDNIRWLVGGSVNLSSTLDRQGLLNLINDLRVEPLPPFSESEVEQFVTTMLEERNVPFEPNVLDRVKEILGKPIPFFLQLLTQELYRDWRRHRQKLTADHVNRVFDRALLGEVARDKLQHFRSRIHTHYPADARRAAYALLDQLSRRDEPTPRHVLLSAYSNLEQSKPNADTGPELEQSFYDLMFMLQNDFYIEETADRSYDFSSRTLKLWWRKYYG